MTSPTSPIAFIIGVGPGVGVGVAKAFVANGYKVAVGSRKPSEANTSPDWIHIPLDLSIPSSVSEAFAKVQETLGTPSVVVYNASGNILFSGFENPLKVSVEEFQADLNINTTSVYAAIKESVKGWEGLPFHAFPTFIFTGNGLNSNLIPGMMSLGIGKSGTAHMIEHLAKVNPMSGHKFYYTDQRDTDGSAPYWGIDGDAHGRHYVELAKGKSQGIWLQTFTKDGYKNFRYAK